MQDQIQSLKFNIASTVRKKAAKLLSRNSPQHYYESDIHVWYCDSLLSIKCSYNNSIRTDLFSLL